MECMRGIPGAVGVAVLVEVLIQAGLKGEE